MVYYFKFIVILGALAAAVAKDLPVPAEPISVSVADAAAADNGIEDKARQEVQAQNLVKQVSSKLQTGAANFLSGVEHFVVGVLGAINNVNVQQQIEEAYKNAEAETTTRDPDEEEEITTTPRPTTTRSASTTVRYVSSTAQDLWTTKKFAKPSRRPSRTTLSPEFEDEEITETTKRRYKVRTRSTTPIPSTEGAVQDSEIKTEAVNKIIVGQFHPISSLYQNGPTGQYAPIYSPANPIFQAVKAPVPAAAPGEAPVAVPVVFQPIGIPPVPPAPSSVALSQVLKSNESVADALAVSTEASTAAPSTQAPTSAPAAPTKKPSNPLSQFSNNRVKYTIRPRPNKPKPVENFPLPLGTILRPANEPRLPPPVYKPAVAIRPVQPVVQPRPPAQAPFVPEVLVTEATETTENVDETTEEPDENETDSDNARRSVK